jgi:hypothetical protein
MVRGILRGKGTKHALSVVSALPSAAAAHSVRPLRATELRCLLLETVDRLSRFLNLGVDLRDLSCYEGFLPGSGFAEFLPQGLPFGDQCRHRFAESVDRRANLCTLWRLHPDGNVGERRT